MAEDRLDSGPLFRLYAEVINGVDPEESSLPDTPLVRETRAKLERSVAEAKAQGITVDPGDEILVAGDPDVVAV